VHASEAEEGVMSQTEVFVTWRGPCAVISREVHRSGSSNRFVAGYTLNAPPF